MTKGLYLRKLKHRQTDGEIEFIKKIRLCWKVLKKSTFKKKDTFFNQNFIFLYLSVSEKRSFFFTNL